MNENTWNAFYGTLLQKRERVSFYYFVISFPTRHEKRTSRRIRFVRISTFHRADLDRGEQPRRRKLHKTAMRNDTLIQFT